MLLAVIDTSSIDRYIRTHRHTPLWLVFLTMLLLSWLCPLASAFFLANVAHLSWGVMSPKSFNSNDHNLSWQQVWPAMGRKTILCVQRNTSKMSLNRSGVYRCKSLKLFHQCTPRSLSDKTCQDKETSTFCSDHSLGSVSTRHSAFIALTIYIFKSPRQMRRLEAKLSATSQQL